MSAPAPTDPTPVLNGKLDADNRARRALHYAQYREEPPTTVLAYLNGKAAEGHDLAYGPSVYGAAYWRNFAERMEELAAILEPSEARPLDVAALEEELGR